MFQTHATHPSLIYFRSVSTGAGWRAGRPPDALMDLALSFETVVDDPESHAAAVLLRHEGLRLIGEIISLIALEPRDDPTSANQAQAVWARLKAAGYRLRPWIDAAEFAAERRQHAQCNGAIAEHLGTPRAPLLP